MKRKQTASSAAMNNLAIIPARGGSKRIPNKNIIDFFGKPMIIYTLDAARDSGVFSKIYVSTEDIKIRGLVEQHGYEVIERPAELATDTASSIPVVLNLFNTLERRCEVFENVCLLMANCPVRDHVDICGSWEAFKDSPSNFMMSVFRYGMFYPFWALHPTDEGLKPFFGDKYFNIRSQELPEVFCPSGAIRWFNVEAFKEVKHFYGPNLKPYIIPWYKAIDIDEYEDLMVARMVVEAMKTHPEYFKQ